MTKRSPHESDLHKPLLFQKVGVFVDAENIELSGLKHHGGRTDYRRILEKVGDREIIRILYYKPVYKEISSTFHAFWKGLGGEIKQPSKNADSFLIIDAVTLAEKMDVAIILGGDKDYLPLVWYLKSRGCRVEIWSWPEATSPEVMDAADVYFPLTVDFVVPIDASERERERPQADRPPPERAAPIAPIAPPKPPPPPVAPKPRPASVRPAVVTDVVEEAESEPGESPAPKKRRRGKRGGRGRKKSGTSGKDPGDSGPED